MSILRLTVKSLDALAEFLGRIAALFAFLMVLVTCYVVLTRYVFNTGSIAVQEMVTYFNALLFSLGVGYTLKHNAHVRVDIFYSKASVRTQHLIDLLGTLLLLLPVMIFILWACWSYVSNAWAIHEKSSDAGGLPFVYLLKTLILMLGFVLIAQGLAQGIKSALSLLRVPGFAQDSEPEETLI